VSTPTTTTLDVHLASLQRDRDMIVAVLAETAADSLVPTCPDWTLRQLVHHLGGVQRWAARHVAEGSPVNLGDLPDIVDHWPADEALGSWFAEGADALVATLASAPPELECWTFLPAPSPVLFWARRQAHESTIHRIDAELAGGRAPSLVDVAAARDGIEEVLFGFGGRPGKWRDGEHSLRLTATDTSDVWTLRLSDRGIAAEPEPASAECSVSGSINELYRFVWNRIDLGDVSVEGDPDVARSWRQEIRVRWN
jgi:uncharacterized protein (TIGR03083 family)